MRIIIFLLFAVFFFFFFNFGFLDWTCAQCSLNDSVLGAVAHPALVGFLVSVLVILLSGFQLLRSID